MVTVKESVVEHRQMINDLTKVVNDHEKRIRLMERFVFGMLAIIGVLEFIFKKG